MRGYPAKRLVDIVFLFSAFQLHTCCGYDIAARLGGEEFVALLADTNAQNAASTAERLRANMEALEVYANGHCLRFTASFGIAVFQPDDTLESVLRQADQALYAAKLAGRNRVMQKPFST